MKEKNEFSKRIVFIYNYFKSHCADFGVSKPTKEAFITFLGISRGKLQSWERGYWPKDEDLQSISQKMRLSFAWLAFGTGEPFDVQDTRPVQTAGMDAMQSATGHDIDPLRRMTQAIGIPEDAWSISDYLGIPACRRRSLHTESHGVQAVTAAAVSAASRAVAGGRRRRYGVTPAWLDSGLGRSHEARAEEEPQELRTLRGMVDMLTAHGGTNEQVQELILNYGKRGDAGAEAGDGTKREQSVRTAFL